MQGLTQSVSPNGLHLQLLEEQQQTSAQQASAEHALAEEVEKEQERAKLDYEHVNVEQVSTGVQLGSQQQVEQRVNYAYNTASPHTPAIGYGDSASYLRYM